nr:MAG TPA: hypothetical protein [Caudoviricetes sp.]
MNIANKMESLFEEYSQNQQESTLIERIKRNFLYFDDFCYINKEDIADGLETLDVLHKYANKYKTVTGKDFRTALDHKSGLYKFDSEENAFIINYYSIHAVSVGQDDMFRVSFNMTLNKSDNKFTLYLNIYHNTGHVQLRYEDLDNMKYTKEELYAINKCLEKTVNKFEEITKCSGFNSIKQDLDKVFEHIKYLLEEQA